MKGRVNLDRIWNQECMNGWNAAKHMPDMLTILSVCHTTYFSSKTLVYQFSCQCLLLLPTHNSVKHTYAYILHPNHFVFIIVSKRILMSKCVLRQILLYLERNAHVYQQTHKHENLFSSSALARVDKEVNEKSFCGKMNDFSQTSQLTN